MLLIVKKVKIQEVGLANTIFFFNFENKQRCLMNYDTK